MKLEHLCVSLQLAKEIKESGWPQEESLFYWVDRGWGEDGQDSWSLMGHGEFERDEFEYIAAPTAAEIGEVLPENIITWKNTNGDWPITWHCELIHNPLFTSHAETEVDTRAKYYLYLKKANII